MTEERRHMAEDRRIDPGWDGRERRSHNPWIDVLMSALDEQKNELRKQTDLLMDIDRRLMAVEDLMPDLKPMARAWAGAGVLAKIGMTAVAAAGAMWALVEWAKEHLR